METPPNNTDLTAMGIDDGFAVLDELGIVTLPQARQTAITSVGPMP